MAWNENQIFIKMLLVDQLICGYLFSEHNEMVFDENI